MKGMLFRWAVIVVFLPFLFSACAPEQTSPEILATLTAIPAATAAATPTSTLEAAAAVLISPTPKMTPTSNGLVEPLPIRLQFAEFDPLAGVPALSADQRLDTYPGDENVYLLQFDGPILAEWQQALDATGAKRLGYVPEFAYLVRMSLAQKEAAAALPHVRWIGLYQPGYKIAPALAKESTGRCKLTVLTFPGVDMDAVKTKAAHLGGVVEQSGQNDLSGTLRIEIDWKQVVPLARLPEVMWIEPYTAPTLH